MIDTLNGLGFSDMSMTVAQHRRLSCYVHVCRLKKCPDQTKMKLCLATCESVRPVLQFFENHVKQHSGKVLHGQAPKGGRGALNVMLSNFLINFLICSKKLYFFGFGPGALSACLLPFARDFVFSFLIEWGEAVPMLGQCPLGNAEGVQ